MTKKEKPIRLSSFHYTDPKLLISRPTYLKILSDTTGTAEQNFSIFIYQEEQTPFCKINSKDKIKIYSFYNLANESDYSKLERKI